LKAVGEVRRLWWPARTCKWSSKISPFSFVFVSLISIPTLQSIICGGVAAKAGAHIGQPNPNAGAIHHPSSASLPPGDRRVEHPHEQGRRHAWSLVVEKGRRVDGERPRWGNVGGGRSLRCGGRPGCASAAGSATPYCQDLRRASAAWLLPRLCLGGGRFHGSRCGYASTVRP
jgi:hypothetical protein